MCSPFSFEQAAPSLSILLCSQHCWPLRLLFRAARGLYLDKAALLLPRSLRMFVVVSVVPFS